MKRLLNRWRALKSEEDGQSLVLGVMSIFMLLMFGAMVMSVGRITTRRIQMQFAADSAVYSASVMESECVNTIALLNTAMAQVRTRALRYSADVNSYGSLAEIRDLVLGLNDRLREALQTEINNLNQQLQSETDPQRRIQIQDQITKLSARYNSLFQDMDPQGTLLAVTDEAFWQQQIDVLTAQLQTETDPKRRGTLQQQIQYLQAQLDGLHENGVPSAPLLSDLGLDATWVVDIVGLDRADIEYGEAYQRANKWVPAARQWLQEMSRLEYTIAILAPYLSAETAYRVARENGAEYVSMFPCSRWLPRDDTYLDVQIYRLGDQWWRIEGGGVVMEVHGLGCGACDECSRCGTCRDCWDISWARAPSQQGSYRICELEDRRWFWRDLMSGDSACIQQTEHINVITWGPDGVRVVTHDEFDPPWLELINDDGTFPNNTMFVRRVGGSMHDYERWDEDTQAWVTVHEEQGGAVEYAYYQWNEATGTWDMPTEDDFTALPNPSVTIDGVRVDVNIDPVIPLPGSATVRILEPPYISLMDNSSPAQEWGRAYLDKDVTFFWAVINTVHVEVRNDRIHLWKNGEHLWTEDADGRWRSHFDRAEEYWWQHRLTEVQKDYYWLYEYMDFGARLAPERNMARLLAHRDVDTAGMPVGEIATASYVPEWASARDWDGNELNPDGWMNVENGTLVKTDGSGPYENEYAYYQVRPCWDMWDTNHGVKQPDGLWEFDYDGDGVADQTMQCPTCEGKGYVLIQPSDVQGRHGRLARAEPDPDPKAEDFLEIKFDPSQTQLVLSDEFFKWGVTTGVWHPTETHFPRGYTGSAPDRPVEYLLHDPNPGFKGVMTGPQGRTARQRGENLRPVWGYFASAAARVRLNRPGETGGWDGLDDGLFFTDVDERTNWIAENLNNLYSKQCASGWSYWDSRMVALNRQVLDKDVLLDLTEPAETGVGWLMRRIAYGAPGGLVQSRQQNLPPGYYDYGHVSGWTSSVYSEYDPQYPPELVRQGLLQDVRPRAAYPYPGQPYTDAEGLYRNPFVESLAARQGPRPTGGQLDYNDLDENSVVH